MGGGDAVFEHRWLVSLQSFGAEATVAIAICY
ncbi:hypothetical protein MTO96_046284, partial [Rhipicephalus appendiculatus]